MTIQVQFSHSVVSDSLQPCESQHARPPCPSPTPGVYSNSCPSSRRCHPVISSFVIPFSSCPQSLPASGSFPMSQFFAWGGQLKDSSYLFRETSCFSEFVSLIFVVFIHSVKIQGHRYFYFFSLCCVSHSVVSDSLRPHGGLLSPPGSSVHGIF